MVRTVKELKTYLSDFDDELIVTCTSGLIHITVDRCTHCFVLENNEEIKEGEKMNYFDNFFQLIKLNDAEKMVLICQAAEDHFKEMYEVNDKYNLIEIKNYFRELIELSESKKSYYFNQSIELKDKNE